MDGSRSTMPASPSTRPASSPWLLLTPGAPAVSTRVGDISSSKDAACLGILWVAVPGLGGSCYLPPHTCGLRVGVAKGRGLGLPLVAVAARRALPPCAKAKTVGGMRRQVAHTKRALMHRKGNKVNFVSLDASMPSC